MVELNVMTLREEFEHPNLNLRRTIAATELEGSFQPANRLGKGRCVEGIFFLLHPASEPLLLKLLSAVYIPDDVFRLISQYIGTVASFFAGVAAGDDDDDEDGEAGGKRKHRNDDAKFHGQGLDGLGSAARARVLETLVRVLRRRVAHALTCKNNEKRILQKGLERYEEMMRWPEGTD